MNVQSVNSFVDRQINFKASSDNKDNTERKQGPTFLDVFATSARNSADLNDTVVVPRTIFKGYLSFMAGTAIGALIPLAKDKKPLLAALSVAAGALTLLGAYFFVRPYVIKDSGPKKPAADKIKTDIKPPETKAAEDVSEKEPAPKVPVETPKTEQPPEASNNTKEAKTEAV